MSGQPLVENYPLVVGGVEDYPVKVGSMLLTMVDPVRGFEREYQRPRPLQSGAQHRRQPLQQLLEPRILRRRRRWRLGP